jgi:hypothetical protein
MCKAGLCASGPDPRSGRKCCGKAEQSQIGHGFLSNRVCPQSTAETGAGREDAHPPEKLGGVLEPPEGLVGFSKRLFPRDADILQEVEVVALGNFAQRPALAGTRKPSDDYRACAGDKPANPRFRARQGAWSDIPQGQPVGNQGGHGWARLLVPGRRRPDGAGSIGAGKACAQSIVSRGCPSFIDGGGVASLSPTAECVEII